MTPPKPFVPASCDVRGIEPPWSAFVDLAVQQYGLSRDEAQRLIDEVRHQQGAVQ